MRYEPDILGLCEVDHFEDFFEPELEAAGFQGTFKRKRVLLRSPADEGTFEFCLHPSMRSASRQSRQRWSGSVLEGTKI